MPLNATDFPTQDYWQTPWVTSLARLKPGVTIAQAQANLEPVWQQMEKTSTLAQITRNENFAHVLAIPAARGLSGVREKFSLPARILMSATNSARPAFASGSQAYSVIPFPP